MRNLLFVLLLLVVCVAGLGFYLGWFSFSTSRDPQAGQSRAGLRVDENKVKADARKVREKVIGVAGQAEEQLPGK
jgi:hypothetical protein